jgi:hypothetical protein
MVAMLAATTKLERLKRRIDDSSEATLLPRTRRDGVRFLFAGSSLAGNQVLGRERTKASGRKAPEACFEGFMQAAQAAASE